MSGTTKLLTAGGGGVNITAASSIASDVTVNVPSQNCTLGIQGPAFSATGSSTQTFGSGVWTKIAFQTETFDTNSCFDNATNYRFTPTTAGYYQIDAALRANETGAGGVVVYLSIYKNGAAFTDVANRDDNGQPQNMSHSCVVYCNGSTDYIELYGYISGGTFVTPATRRFSGAMVRSA